MVLLEQKQFYLFAVVASSKKNQFTPSLQWEVVLDVYIFSNLRG